MKKRLITLIAIGALIGAVQTGTAQDTAAYLVMIVNQGTQISNQVQALMRMDTHITQLTGQFEHLRDSALGQIGAIADPIADLVAVPTDLLNTARDWHSDFTGDAGSLIDALTELGAGTSLSESWRDVLETADTVTEADIRNVYQSGADDVVRTFERRRNYADRSVVLGPCTRRCRGVSCSHRSRDAREDRHRRRREQCFDHGATASGPGRESLTGTTSGRTRSDGSMGRFGRRGGRL